MSGQTKVTTDHKTIQKWIEARGGQPATVKATAGKGDAGILRVNFPGYSGEDSLEDISWDEFFKKFDEKHLAFMYQEQTADGKESRFFKFVSQETAKEAEHEKHHDTHGGKHDGQKHPHQSHGDSAHTEHHAHH
jgi:hypothetical protein